MSVFLGLKVKDDYRQVTVEELRETAAKKNFTIPAKDEDDYLTLLQAADLAINHVDSLPAYTDPGLLPRGVGEGESLAKARPFTKPEPQDNPLNAWSHKCNITLPGATGPLSGRAVAVKDNVSVAGLPMTLGTFPEFVSEDGKFPISEIDASVVGRVLEAGGTVAGTATCENYSACALSYSSASGPVENPWAKGYATGGSSSGCAGLVAASMKKKLLSKKNMANGSADAEWDSGIDLAIGGDQGGSIRIPASYSGIYGLKPTHGLCPYTGIASLHPMMDHCGPMATSVADIATLLSVMAGYDLLDHRMTPETPLRANVPDYAQNLSARIEAKRAKGEWTPSQAGRGLRVGILTEAWGAPTLSAEVAATVRAAASRFAALGASVADVSIPLHADGPLIWTAATRAQMAAVGIANAAPAAGSPSHNLPSLRPPQPLTQRWLDLLSRHNPAMVNVVLSAEFLGQKYHPAAVAKAHAHVLQLRAAYDAALRECDVLVTPVTPTVAPPHPPLETWGVMERMRVAAGNSANTCPFNVTGHPALSMPVGWGAAAAGAGGGGGGGEGEQVKTLPIGMQIIGRRWDEDTVLYAASVWEVGGLGLESVYKPQA